VNRHNSKIPIAREGVPFLVPLLAISVLFWISHWPLPGAFFSLLALFVLFFFRDPERSIPPGEKAVLSPADGRVIEVQPSREENLLKGPSIRISVFMSLFNVHVNRNPLSGRIVDILYSPGRFLRANLDRASAANEQNALLIETPRGTRIVVVQVAGLIARRIVCWVGKGESVERGQRFGLIRFGSRLDVYLPATAQVQVQPGQKTTAGQTILGILP
jgi:phosphatidylserine decarboxylase